MIDVGAASSEDAVTFISCVEINKLVQSLAAVPTDLTRLVSMES